jgi:uncharacterized 2Fe-2S/4Fe-4S cluster protein (DUF4445 family)
MSQVRVTFLPENRSISVDEGTTIAEAARQAAIVLTAPCAGSGTCGRCRVLLADVGSVLACQHRITDDLTVEIPATSRPGSLAVHLTSSIESSESSRPLHPLASSAATSVNAHGVAIDIGTSTVACELVDLRTGHVLIRAGRANSQAAFGAEVTRRIEHVEDHGSDDLAESVVADINALVAEMTQAVEEPVDLGAVTIAGNTAMLHFLHRYDPSSIRRAPHVPLVASPPTVPARELGLELESDPAVVYSLPSIGGWVGGDITAGILATGLHKSDALTMMIDIGTNGEIVLGNREWLMACAASAGPAFEGCGISCGSTATPGAIDRLSVDESGTISWHTIDDEKPHGLCGSGLISAIAGLFRAGMIDRAGGMLAADDSLDEPGILLVPASQTSTGRPIALLQRDIDSVLLAKAALFAGTQSLLQAADLSVSDLDRLIICGGFGSVLDVEDAITLGLIPDLGRAKITFAGNTSLRGARIALLNQDAWGEAIDIAARTGCIELIDDPDYFERFSSARFLPHTDLTLFPSVKAPTRRA